MTEVDRGSPAAIRAAGLDALRRALGPVGMVRFLQQFEAGRGDYTAERHTWLAGVTLDELARAIDIRPVAE